VKENIKKQLINECRDFITWNSHKLVQLNSYNCLFSIKALTLSSISELNTWP